MPVARIPDLVLDTYPADRTADEQWLTWKETDGRKIPRAPYAHPEKPDRFVSAQDSAVWTDFETAAEWAAKLSGFELAFTIRDRDAYPEEDLVLVDYDGVRDPETGAVHPTVREHLEAAGSYADVSTSGTGVHILCRGELPEGVKTIDDSLGAADGFPAAGIEVYDSARYVAMTGAHIQATPRETTEAQAFLDRLVEEYATVTAGTPDELLDPPATSKEELSAIETTGDLQDVFDAIQHTGPRDIQLRSSVTEERVDGSRSLDPCWTSSTSGTRLAEVDGGWIYRKGMIGLDALQVVALEEGIIGDERTYPSGEAFWEAVEALRGRGAHIPRYEADEASAAVDGLGVHASAGGGAGATESSGGGHGAPTAGTAGTASNALRDVELERLREHVIEQRTTIEELEGRIEALRGQLERREAELGALREEADPEEGDGEESDRDSSSRSWARVTRWLGDR